MRPTCTGWWALCTGLCFLGCQHVCSPPSRPHAAHNLLSLGPPSPSRALSTVSQQQASDASDARRWAEEADGLTARVASLSAELGATKDQLAGLQAMQSSNGLRMVQLEGDTADLHTQLQVGCRQSRCLLALAVAVGAA